MAPPQRKVREQSSTEERCGPHIAIAPAVLRSSDTAVARPQRRRRRLL